MLKRLKTVQYFGGITDTTVCAFCEFNLWMPYHNVHIRAPSQAETNHNIAKIKQRGLCFLVEFFNTATEFSARTLFAQTKLQDNTGHTEFLESDHVY